MHARNGTIIDAKSLAAKSWFGYGRWDAPYWFIGMEPGGDDTHASYEAWLDLGGGELIDCRAHHQWQLETLGIDDPKWTKYHRTAPPNALQATWRPLILLLLACKGEPCGRDDVREYQRDRWGMVDGETAVVELNALHAPSIATQGVEREKYRPARIRIIAERLKDNPPDFAVFYGIQYKRYYEEIAGVAFDADGFGIRGGTVSALVPQPARAGKTNEWWIELGRKIRSRIESATGRP